MELPANKFIHALATGRPQYGLWLGLPDNSVAEIAAGAGFDWLLIDHEHAPFELRDILSHLQAMAAYPVAPIVRPVEGSPALLKKLLDIGVQSFLIPMVDNAAQARALVTALRYPPAGKRGLGTSMARAAGWNRVPDYLQKANDEICLIVQVETTDAMDNLDEILAVAGVDGVFIGPSDLSASMGHIGNAGHPEVVAAISDALSRIKAAGKYAGLLCLDPKLVDNYIAQGADFIGIGVDTMILVQGMQKVLQQRLGESGASPAPQAGY